LAERASDPDAERRRRRWVAMLLVGGGGAAALSGVVTGSLVLVIFGVGWLIGGGAISSLEPKDTKDKPEG
jgi:hypothetical protein